MFFYHFIGEKHIVKIHISIKHIVNIILYQTFSHITFISLSVYMSIKKRYKNMGKYNFNKHLIYIICEFV